jgi:glycosyltransferase involved in cell wall biosynthesis
VDVDTFRPVASERRRQLQAHYGVSADMPVVLHVGHLKAGRGIGVLAELAQQRACQVVLVTSSSTAQDRELGHKLSMAGVKVVSEYQPHVEHWYQLADCYVFPVESDQHAIGVPLSVLEALACDLPVITTRFGGLPEVFKQTHPGLVFVDSRAAIIREAVAMCGCPQNGTRALALPFSWPTLAAKLLEQVLDRRSSSVRDGRRQPGLISAC